MRVFVDFQGIGIVLGGGTEGVILKYSPSLLRAMLLLIRCKHGRMFLVREARRIRGNEMEGLFAQCALPLYALSLRKCPKGCRKTQARDAPK